ncbi:hypothetical protein VNO80_02177 [Phaseolus coccineus]|uniref:Uncharacterized protein n=1 Tax=Phaseolus coccineus TaxID=3886 RepID=A0AAN9RL83_PHACN
MCSSPIIHSLDLASDGAWQIIQKSVAKLLFNLFSGLKIVHIYVYLEEKKITEFRLVLIFTRVICICQYMQSKYQAYQWLFLKTFYHTFFLHHIIF